MTNTLIINHNAGFFSCCSIRLRLILDYYNKHKQVPTIIDSRNQFRDYKRADEKNKDYIHKFFTDNQIDINSFILLDHTHFPIVWGKYSRVPQFENYKSLNYTILKPFIEKYFSPLPQIVDLVNQLKEKYSINTANLCFIYYRRRDKVKETHICKFNEILEQASEHLKSDPSIQFLYMTDTASSVTFKNKFANTIIINELGSDRTYEQAQYMLASVLIMAEAKYVVCTSGNVSLWAMLYRGNANNVCQYLKPKKFKTEGHISELYNPKQSVFWL